MKEKELIRSGKSNTGLSKEYEKLDADILGYSSKGVSLDDDGIDMDKLSSASHQQPPKSDKNTNTKDAIEFGSSLIDYEDLNTGGPKKAKSAVRNTN